MYSRERCGIPVVLLPGRLDQSQFPQRRNVEKAWLNSPQVFTGLEEVTEKKAKPSRENRKLKGGEAKGLCTVVVFAPANSQKQEKATGMGGKKSSSSHGSGKSDPNLGVALKVSLFNPGREKEPPFNPKRN